MAGWNGSGMGGNSTPQKPKAAAKKPSPIRGLIVGGLVIVLAVVTYFAFFSGFEKQQSVMKEKKPTKIKETKPAKAPPPKPAKPEKPKRPQPDENGIIDPGPPPNFRGSVITNANGTVYYSPDPGFAARYHAAMAEQDKLPFKTRAEREIASIIDVEPGQFVLETEFSPALEKDFLEHLNDPIITNDDDDEHTKQLKQFMRDLKPQLKQAMDRGEKITDLLKDYRRELVKANALKENLARELAKLQREAKSEEEVKDYINAANKMLDDYGIEHFPVKVSPATLHLIERNNEENQQ